MQKYISIKNNANNVVLKQILEEYEEIIINYGIMLK
ncbi:hypothetical protein BJV40_005148 [Clostridium beijerinckii]|nr:hypothetical protein [Clostridium beijerinckii]